MRLLLAAAAAIARRHRRDQRRRANLSEQVGDHHRAVRRRRAVRCAGAHHGRPHESDARPILRGGERHRRRRLDRCRPRGARGARRLHHQLRAPRHACRQRRDLSAALRHADRPRAGRAAAEQSDGGGEQADAAGEEPQGADRVAQGQPGQGDRGNRRRRFRCAHRRRLSRRASPACACNTCPIAAPRRP